MTDAAERLRQLPSVDRLLNDPGAADLIHEFGRDAFKESVRVALDAARQWIRQGGNAPSLDELVGAAASLLQRQRIPSLRPVINATGIILDSQFGRAPLSESAQQAILAVAASYSTLEYQLDEGSHSQRDRHIESVITAVTGAEAAFVVNNGAAAILLIMATFAQNREVIISRGQLIEIGGGIRLPDIMKQSGARLVEVGMTNSTHLDDFAGAITPQSALILRTNPPNFKQIGFVEQPGAREIVRLAHNHQVYAVDDLGSGALLDTAVYGLDHQPMVQESLQAGFDLVAFSGDKLVGGPQAGIIAGRADLIAKLKKHPLARTLRIDKLSLAGLVATLEHYQQNEAIRCIPVWQMISVRPDVLRARVETWAAQVGGEVLADQSAVGGSNLPGETLPTFVLALNTPTPDDLAAQLRRASMPVIARIAEGRVLLDPRTILPDQDSMLIGAISNLGPR